MSIRSAASCGQPRQLSSVPRGARTGRGPAAAGGVLAIADESTSRGSASVAQPLDDAFAEPAGLADRYDGDDRLLVGQVDVVRVAAAAAGADERLVAADLRLGVPGLAAGRLARRDVVRVAIRPEERIAEGAVTQMQDGRDGEVARLDVRDDRDRDPIRRGPERLDIQVRERVGVGLEREAVDIRREQRQQGVVEGDGRRRRR